MPPILLNPYRYAAPGGGGGSNYATAVTDATANGTATLLAWHKFGEAGTYPSTTNDLIDSSGNSRHGTTVSSPVGGQTALLVGDPATSTSFANPDRVNVTYGSWMAGLAGASVWFNSADVVTSQCLIDRDDGGNRCFQFQITGSKLELIFWNSAGGGPTFLTGTTTLATNTTYRASFHLDPSDSKMKVYLNGSLEAASGAATSLRNNASQPLSYAFNQQNSKFLALGKLAHATLWGGTGLSATRELAHYTAGITP